MEDREAYLDGEGNPQFRVVPNTGWIPLGQPFSYNTSGAEFGVLKVESAGFEFHLDAIDITHYAADSSIDFQTNEIGQSCSASAFSDLMDSNPPMMRWHAARYNGGTKLLENFAENVSPNITMEVQGIPTVVIDTDHGATVQQVSLVGNKDTDGISFFNATTGESFSICALYRYYAYTAPAAFINTRDGGDEYFNMAPPGDTLWHAECLTSSEASSNGTLDLHIGWPGNAGAADWAFSSIFVWDNVLSEVELSTMKNAMETSLHDLRVNLFAPNACGASQVHRPSTSHHNLISETLHFRVSASP